MANIFDVAVGRWRALTTDDLPGNAGGGGGGSTVDRELVVTTYVVANAFAGASVGDTITCTQVLNVAGASPVTISTVWRNQTTAADLATAPSAANLTLVGTGGATAANQTTANSTLSQILTMETTIAGRIGAPDESAPGNDTASSGLNGRLIRIAQRLTDLISRVPSALVSDRLQTDVLGQPSTAFQLAVTTTSASQALTTSVRRISMVAIGCNMRYVVGTGAQTANATTSHFIQDGERLDIMVPANGVVAAIRDTAATANGTLHITQLV